MVSWRPPTFLLFPLSPSSPWPVPVIPLPLLPLLAGERVGAVDVCPTGPCVACLTTVGYGGDGTGGTRLRVGGPDRRVPSVRRLSYY